jgi:hypothetical protein
MEVKEKLIMGLKCCINGYCDGCPMIERDPEVCQDDLMEECLRFLEGEHK